MGKLTCWILAITLLCSWCWPVNGFDRMRKHRSLGIHEEDAGEIALFLIAVVIGMIGKKLDKGYKCPVYCGVKHNHIYYEIKKSNISPVNGLHRTVGDSTKEQSASDIRPIASID